MLTFYNFCINTRLEVELYIHNAFDIKVNHKEDMQPI